MTVAAAADLRRTLTSWAVFQSEVVKVMVEGTNSTLSCTRVIRTSEVGAAVSLTVADWAVFQVVVEKVREDVKVMGMVRFVQPAASPAVVRGVAVASLRAAPGVRVSDGAHLEVYGGAVGEGADGVFGGGGVGVGDARPGGRVFVGAGLGAVLPAGDGGVLGVVPNQEDLAVTGDGGEDVLPLAELPAGDEGVVGVGPGEVYLGGFGVIVEVPGGGEDVRGGGIVNGHGAVAGGAYGLDAELVVLAVGEAGDGVVVGVNPDGLAHVHRHGGGGLGREDADGLWRVPVRGGEGQLGLG